MRQPQHPPAALWGSRCPAGEPPAHERLPGKPPPGRPLGYTPQAGATGRSGGPPACRLPPRGGGACTKHKGVGQTAATLQSPGGGGGTAAGGGSGRGLQCLAAAAWDALGRAAGSRAAVCGLPARGSCAALGTPSSFHPRVGQRGRQAAPACCLLTWGLAAGGLGTRAESTLARPLVWLGVALVTASGVRRAVCKVRTLDEASVLGRFGGGVSGERIGARRRC